MFERRKERYLRLPKVPALISTSANSCHFTYSFISPLRFSERRNTIPSHHAYLRILMSNIADWQADREETLNVPSKHGLLVGKLSPRLAYKRNHRRKKNDL